jgi:hypothetical protein
MFDAFATHEQVSPGLKTHNQPDIDVACACSKTIEKKQRFVLTASLTPTLSQGEREKNKNRIESWAGPPRPFGRDNQD